MPLIEEQSLQWHQLRETQNAQLPLWFHNYNPPWEREVGIHMFSIETERGSHDEEETSIKVFAGWIAWEEISLLSNLKFSL